MSLKQNGNIIAGTVSLDLNDVKALIPNWTCSPVRGSSPIRDGVIYMDKFDFSDMAGNKWKMNLTSSSMDGTVDNNSPGCINIKSNGKLILKRIRGYGGGTGG